MDVMNNKEELAGENGGGPVRAIRLRLPIRLYRGNNGDRHG